MFVRTGESFQTGGAGADQRRHPRKTVFKSALLYPVLKEASLAISNLSSQGISGRSALDLSLRQQVHVSFNAADFISAEVRWTNGDRCGLLMEEPLLWLSSHDTLVEQLAADQQPRDARYIVDMQATLVTSAPVMVGTIRNLSAEGMMIEVPGIREGTRLLVKSRDRQVRMGACNGRAVAWSACFSTRASNRKIDAEPIGKDCVTCNRGGIASSP